MTADYDVCDQNLFPSQTVPGTAENFAKTSHESSNRLGNHFGQAVKRLESKKARNPDLIVRSPTTPVWHLGKVSINVRARSRDPNMNRPTDADEFSRPTSISRKKSDFETAIEFRNESSKSRRFSVSSGVVHTIKSRYNEPYGLHIIIEFFQIPISGNVLPYHYDEMSL